MKLSLYNFRGLFSDFSFKKIVTLLITRFTRTYSQLILWAYLVICHLLLIMVIFFRRSFFTTGIMRTHET